MLSRGAEFRSATHNAILQRACIVARDFTISQQTLAYLVGKYMLRNLSRSGRVGGAPPTFIILKTFLRPVTPVVDGGCKPPVGGSPRGSTGAPPSSIPPGTEGGRALRALPAPEKEGRTTLASRKPAETTATLSTSCRPSAPAYSLNAARWKGSSAPKAAKHPFTSPSTFAVKARIGRDTERRVLRPSKRQ